MLFQISSILREKKLITSLVTVLLFSFFYSNVYAVTEIKHVYHVNDGDTFEFELDGDTNQAHRIRILGINANESVDEDGNCHANEAKLRLKQLIEGKNVTATVDDIDVTLRGRPARWIDLGDTDIGDLLLREGLALPYAHETETARNDKYLDTAAEAQKSGIGIWDPEACGAGPDQDIDIDMKVSWDAVGNDSDNVNGEWIDIINTGNRSLSLKNWRLRDPATRFYEFSDGASIPAGKMMRIHVGHGTDSSLEKYWGRDAPLFSNDIGQGAYLLDPDNDIRASFSYPCRINCSDSMVGKVYVEVNYDAEGDDRVVNPNGEWVDIINTSDETIELYGYFLDSFYHFEQRHHINPHGKLRIRVGKGTESEQVLYRGSNRALFSNSGGEMSLRRADNLLIDTYTWPEPDLPTVPEGAGNLVPIYLLLQK